MKAVIDYKGVSDIELTLLLKSQDDHHAFTEIYKRYGKFLLSFAYRKVYDADVAQDLVQDTFSALWNKRADLEVTKDFESLIFRSVKNRILDYYKHAKVTDRYLEYFKNNFQFEENSTDHLVRHKDLAVLIQKEIDALPEKMRVIFELSRKTNMSRKEIAQYLDVPEGNVKINMQRALKILKGRLGNSFSLIFFM